MAAGGGGCGGNVVVVVVVVVVLVVVSPARCQTGKSGGGGGGGGGMFQLFKSCGNSTKLRNLPVDQAMWLRTTGEEVTLTALENNKVCVLPPNITHQVTDVVHLTVQVAGAEGEMKDVCYFPKHAAFQLSRSILMVSCLADKRQAEAEMLGGEESSSSAPLPPVSPQPRALDPPPPSTPISPHHTSTTPSPQSSREPLTTTTTLEPSSNRTTPKYLDTTLRMTEAASSTTLPPSTDPMVVVMVVETTPREETMNISVSTSGHVTEEQMTDAPVSSTRSATLSSTTTQETTNPIEKLTLPPLLHPAETKNEKISVRQATVQKNGARRSGEDLSGDPNDHVYYLAGAGAGVAVLVLGVVVVVCVAHRKRKAKANVNSDLFISGGYKGSMNNVDMSGSGAYLNAHVMYSGAEPEFVESFELEERILNSNVSYSSHDIPKCLKES